MENAFHFTWKDISIFVLTLGHVEKWFDKKATVTNQKKNRKQTITIHLLPNASRSKGRETMKFGQLIEYDMRNIFLKKHTQNVVKKLVPDPYLKNQNWEYLWINSLKFYTVCFCSIY